MWYVNISIPMTSVFIDIRKKTLGPRYVLTLEILASQYFKSTLKL